MFDSLPKSHRATQVGNPSFSTFPVWLAKQLLRLLAAFLPLGRVMALGRVRLPTPLASIYRSQEKTVLSVQLPEELGPNIYPMNPVTIVSTGSKDRNHTLRVDHPEARMSCVRPPGNDHERPGFVRTEHLRQRPSEVRRYLDPMRQT